MKWQVSIWLWWVFSTWFLFHLLNSQESRPTKHWAWLGTLMILIQYFLIELMFITILKLQFLSKSVGRTFACAQTFIRWSLSIILMSLIELWFGRPCWSYVLNDKLPVFILHSLFELKGRIEFIGHILITQLIKGILRFGLLFDN